MTVEQRLVDAPYRALTPLETPTFADDDSRRRLTSTALLAFRALVEKWDLTTVEAAALLGVSPSTWERIKRGSWESTLSQDQLTRVSALVGVFKGLHLLFLNDMADRWPRLANRGPLFEGQSPIAAMIDGGIPRMLDVRRHVDAIRGGV